jgi:hypothetical protein
VITELTRRSQYLRRWGALKQERSSWFDHWREISDFLLPRSGRFFTSDRNRGGKRHNNILDECGTRANRVLAAGMMAGMTSPARPWFRLATPDEGLMEYAPVKRWLDSVAKMMRTVFAKSNTYRALHSVYKELAGFGTAANIIVPDFQTVLHCTPLTIGEYCISTDAKGTVSTLAREYEATVAQLAEDFGLDALSPSVRQMYNDSHFDKWVPVVHVIEPRKIRDYGRRDNLNMPWKSCYFEAGGNEDKFLRESGFPRFPALCPRWEVGGGDIYGNSPGMEALGSIKQLQHDQLRKSQGIDYQVKPPIALPAALKDQPHSTLPGGTAYYDMAGGTASIKSMWDVRLDLQHLVLDIQDVRGRIDQTHYVDLFLMLAQDTRSNITAREIAERHEEKLLMLGPVLERLHNELLQPLVDLAFDEMIHAGIVPPPPPELHEQDLNVEFVSVLAQAQRAVGVQSVDRLIGMIGSVALMQANAGVVVTALDKLDIDQAIDAYADMLGVDPNVIVADDKVAIIRKARADAQAQAQQAAVAAEAANAAKTLSDTDTEGKNALTDVMGQFSGYAVPGTL